MISFGVEVGESDYRNAIIKNAKLFPVGPTGCSFAMNTLVMILGKKIAAKVKMVCVVILPCNGMRTRNDMMQIQRTAFSSMRRATKDWTSAISTFFTFFTTSRSAETEDATQPFRVTIDPEHAFDLLMLIHFSLRGDPQYTQQRRCRREPTGYAGLRSR